MGRRHQYTCLTNGFVSLWAVTGIALLALILILVIEVVYLHKSSGGRLVAAAKGGSAIYADVVPVVYPTEYVKTPSRCAKHPQFNVARPNPVRLRLSRNESRVGRRSYDRCDGLTWVKVTDRDWIITVLSLVRSLHRQVDSLQCPYPTQTLDYVGAASTNVGDVELPDHRMSRLKQIWITAMNGLRLFHNNIANNQLRALSDNESPAIISQTLFQNVSLLSVSAKLKKEDASLTEQNDSLGNSYVDEVTGKVCETPFYVYVLLLLGDLVLMILAVGFAAWRISYVDFHVGRLWRDGQFLASAFAFLFGIFVLLNLYGAVAFGSVQAFWSAP